MSTMIDHVGFRAADFDRSRAMYVAALSELGFEVLGEGEFEGDQYLLMGRDGRDGFCIHTVGTAPGRDRPTSGAHVGFIAPDADAVDRWHDAATANGGTSIGDPGVRPEYSGYYYAAFVLDPDGNNVEAVFNTPNA